MEHDEECQDQTRADLEIVNSGGRRSDVDESDSNRAIARTTQLPQQTHSVFNSLFNIGEVGAPIRPFQGEISKNSTLFSSEY
jgi:hypothetical protein